MTTDQGTLIIDARSMGENNHETCFYLKDYKSLFFDSFGGAVDKLIFKQLTKPITFNKCKIQDINSTLCGTYCLYFFYLKGRMSFYNAALENVFGRITFWFGNSSKTSQNKCTSLFVQKPYLRTKYIGSNLEEDSDKKVNLELKNYQILLEYRIKIKVICR